MADELLAHAREVYIHNLKRCRAIATRFEKPARNCLALCVCPPALRLALALAQRVGRGALVGRQPRAPGDPGFLGAP